MSFDGRRLLELLPAIYRLRDAELASHTPGLLTPAELADLAALELAATVGALDLAERRRLDDLRAKREQGPLAALLSVLGDEFAVIEENLAQLYDDEFVETAAGWALPYIGDLIGYRPLHDQAGRSARRAEVAHTIGFRRRKGTASMLEQLARDVTGWNARAVEFFALLATTQSMNHLRPANEVAPSMRDGDALEWIGGAFDSIPRTLEVRRITTGGGRYNIPNVGIFLWRIDAHRLRRSPATPDPGDVTGRRFRFSPLGNDIALYTRPESEDEISHLAEPINVPAPISRRRLSRSLDRFYDPERSLAIEFDGMVQSASMIAVCDLSDDGAGWAHEPPAGGIAVDPVLGRLVVAGDVALPTSLRVTFHYGHPGEFAGGEYPRAATFRMARAPIVRVPTDQPTIQAALNALGGAGVVEIVDSGRYREAIVIDVAADSAIELRAGDRHRPTIELTAPLVVRGGATSRAFLNGLLIVADRLDVPAATNELRELSIAHCTLVPGRTLGPNGAPGSPGAPSLTVEIDDLEVSIERSILGPVRVPEGSRTRLTDSILDAGSSAGNAYASDDGAPPAAGGPLEIESTTVVGSIRAEELSASNAILVGRAEVTRRQEGCLRFSYAPLDSIVPRRHRCQPTDGDGAVNVPHFLSLRFGVPGYCRLAVGTPDPILRGSEDESEMGAFRWRYEPQRHADILTRLDEYLRVGLEAGIFHES